MLRRSVYGCRVEIEMVLALYRRIRLRPIVLSYRSGAPETGKTFRIGLPDCLLAALVLYCLSRAAAGQFAEAFLMRCTAFLPIYCLAGRVVRNRSFEPLSAAVAASALLLALYGIAQYAGLLPAGKTFRVVGNFDNPAGYASMLALSVPFILYFALSGRRRMRYAVGVVCAIVVGAIVLSGSRTGILAVARPVFCTP